MTDIRHYLLHGVPITITGAPRILEALHSRLRWFHRSGPAPGSGLYFHYVRQTSGDSGPAARPAGSGRAILEFGDRSALYFEDPPRLHLDMGPRGRMLCDVAEGHVTISHSESEEADPWLLSHLFFTVPLAELLKQRGLYMAHMAGLAIGRKGILIPGQSGAGKTTLTLALLRAGFGFLADDTVFLSTSNGLKVLAFPDEIDITSQTANFFPELRPSDCEKKITGRHKHPICADRVYGFKPRRQCRPTLMVFPQPATSPKSTLTPMPKDEAILGLASNVLRTDPDSAQAHFDALGSLVEQCQCHRLQTGRDFDALATLLRGMLK
jgi:hypothetical protein